MAVLMASTAAMAEGQGGAKSGAIVDNGGKASSGAILAKDSNGNGIPDGLEARKKSLSVNAGAKDKDGDGMPDGKEARQKMTKQAHKEGTPEVKKADQAKGKGSEKREKYVDKRESNQQHRIEQGIKQGQLTSDEVTRLQKQEDTIEGMEKNFESDGKLTREEAKQLREALNDASLQIWAERHDTEGNQKAVSRLGRDVFAKNDLTALIESGEMTRAEARQFCEDFRRMAEMKRKLNSGSLNSEQRAKLQAQYNELLNKYFETR